MHKLLGFISYKAIIQISKCKHFTYSSKLNNEPNHPVTMMASSLGITRNQRNIFYLPLISFIMKNI